MRRRLTDRTWQLTAAAGALALVGMAVALEGGAPVITLALAAIGVLVGAFVLVPRALRAVRGRLGPVLLAVVLGVVAVWVSLWLVRAPGATPGSVVPSSWVRLLPLLVILGATAAGMVLVADAVRVWLGLVPRRRAPWKQMTETQSNQGGIAWRAMAGLALVGWAAFLAAGVVVRIF
ncbi:MAG TPA: hypothetical protein VJU80_05730, partial [Solirubrobacteraceae bacterium]|nr:hypothetical protein [Solirubrobacteraceae bacterium]